MFATLVTMTLGLLLFYAFTCRAPISSNVLLQKQTTLSNSRIKSSMQNPDTHFMFRSILKQEQFPWIVVTGADDSHFKSSLGFIASLQLYEPSTPVIFYDLGLKIPDQQLIKSLCHVEYRRFPFEQYPNHMNLHKGNDKGGYAWKLEIISQVLKEYDAIIWLDSGVRLNMPMHYRRFLLKSQGFISRSTSGPLGTWALPETYAWFNVSKEAYENNDICSGDQIGFVRSSQAYTRMVPTLKQCAGDPKCIMPEGADYTNYRHDQTVMSLLANINAYVCTSEEESVDAQHHFDEYYLDDAPHLLWKPFCRPLIFPPKVTNSTF